MERIKKAAICLVMAMVLCLYGCPPEAEAAQLQYRLGDTIQDFTFTTYDGEVISLYDVLKEKDAVLINIWASWCGPCRYEFPFMEEAYRLYKDNVEIIALSCEPSDSNATLSRFAAEYGLTFKIGQDPLNFLAALGVNSVPTSLLIDRNGTICFIESGAQPDADSFVRLFNVYVGHSYGESVILHDIPPAKPAFEGASNEELTGALEATAYTPSNGYAWPMLVDTVAGRQAVVSSNGGYNSTTSAVNVDVHANVGDAIVITFQVSIESVADLFTITVDGTTVKAFGGQHDWTTYAIPVLQDGNYTLTLAYTKDSSDHRNSDAVWIDSVAVVTGAAAQDALNANPYYVISETTELAVTNPGAKEIAISDERGILAANFGDAKYYIINDDTAYFQAKLDEKCDPERAFFYSNFDSRMIPVCENGYQASAGVDSLERTGYSFSCMFLYPQMTATNIQCIVYFKDEANVDYFVATNQLGTWSYVTDNAAVSPEMGVNESGVSYTIRCIDQFGEPVQGAMIQVCDADICQVFFSDENGECIFVSAPFAWEVHVLRAPEGYVADSTETVLAPVNGGEILFTFTNSQ